MKPCKQIIVIRRDLKMGYGKCSAQACHASLKVFFDRMNWSTKNTMKYNERITTFSFSVSDADGYDFNNDVIEWVQNKFTKICVQVESEEQLLDIHKQAKEAELPVALIKDAGLTEFNGVPTFTCLAIGPADSEEIDKITGNLKLL